jgi:hypothetical protein
MHALVVTYGLGVTQAEHAELSSELAPRSTPVPDSAAGAKRALSGSLAWNAMVGAVLASTRRTTA